MDTRLAYEPSISNIVCWWNLGLFIKKLCNWYRAFHTSHLEKSDLSRIYKQKKDGQYNSQRKMGERANRDLLNITQKDWATWTPLKPGVNSCVAWRVSSSCSTIDTHRATVKLHEHHLRYRACSTSIYRRLQFQSGFFYYMLIRWFMYLRKAIRTYIKTLGHIVTMVTN